MVKKSTSNTSETFTYKSRSSHPDVFCEKDVLTNFAEFTGKHMCQSLFFNKVACCNFIIKETLPQVFSCEFCEIFKNTSFQKTTPLAASAKDKRVVGLLEKI